MAASARFTLGGFIARYAFALLVAGATYNPTPYSYYAWAKSTGFQWTPPIVFAGVVLLIGWFICLRLALRSMGGIGLLLANALLASLYWLMASRSWLPRENPHGHHMDRRVQRRRHPGHRHVLVELAPGAGLD